MYILLLLDFKKIQPLSTKNELRLLFYRSHHDNTVDDSFYNVIKGDVDIVDELSLSYNMSHDSIRQTLT